MIPKFRVWNTFHNMWVKHFYITENGLIYNMEQPHRDLIGAVPIKKSGLIVMQSTGLFDVNGKEIFEGDIVVNKYGNVGYVAYLQQEAGFVVVLKKSDYRLGHRNTGESYDVATNHEIIGNIHQNPELVEG
ncbi:TPA: YopX family protein [Streptococcus suis]